MADEVQPTLFGDGPSLEGAALPAKAPAPGVGRVLMPNRTQGELRPSNGTDDRVKLVCNRG